MNAHWENLLFLYICTIYVLVLWQSAPHHFHPSDGVSSLRRFESSHLSHSQIILRSDVVVVVVFCCFVFANETTSETNGMKSAKKKQTKQINATFLYMRMPSECTYEVLITAKKGERNYYYLWLVQSSIIRVRTYVRNAYAHTTHRTFVSSNVLNSKCITYIIKMRELLLFTFFSTCWVRMQSMFFDCS